MDIPIWLQENTVAAGDRKPGVMSTPMSGVSQGGLAAALRRRVVSQFHHPRGVLGFLAGFVLAHRPSNRERNLWTVELLGIRPTDRVLELGFGPGLAIEACAERASEGQVVGIDHSEVMRRVALKRNARAAAGRRVELHTASFDPLPDLGGAFDRILAVNAAMFAEDSDALLGELVSRLRPGGRLAVTFQSRRAGATSAESKEGGERIAAALRRTGLSDVRVETLPMEPVAAVCVLGDRPDSTG
ncbi:MAG: methyltransferase domain-containing protein [bacterium]|nr:methyltransferase domain-containing protein [bacterium]